MVGHSSPLDRRGELELLPEPQCGVGVHRLGRPRLRELPLRLRRRLPVLCDLGRVGLDSARRRAPHRLPDADSGARCQHGAGGGAYPADKASPEFCDLIRFVLLTSFTVTQYPNN